MLYSAVVSNGSSTIMIAPIQYLLFNTIFTGFLQIFFGIFYKDIPFHFTHRLSYEYKGNISGSSISKIMMFSFLIQGLLEFGFIWVLTLESVEWIGISGNTVNENTHRSYIFYFLIFTYCFKVVSRFCHINMMIFFLCIPVLVILVPFSHYVTPFEQIDRFLDFPSIFVGFILVCMLSAIIEYIFGRASMLVIKSIYSRLDYYLQKEERIMYEYLEDSENDSEEENKIEGTLPYYKEIALELKEKNLRMLSKTVTGSRERSDSMESVLEEIANSNNKNAINDILGINEHNLQFYDRNKNIEFKNATLGHYLLILKIALACFIVLMIAITIDTLIEDPIENIILPLTSALLALLLVLQSYLLTFRKRLQISVIILFGLLF